MRESRTLPTIDLHCSKTLIIEPADLSLDSDCAIGLDLTTADLLKLVRLHEFIIPVKRTK